MSEPAGFVYVWRYLVSPGREAEFEVVYGSAGAWVTLFRRHPGYLSTELLRDRSAPGRYLTVDAWRSRRDFEELRAAYQQELEALDARCEELTVEETHLGDFEPVEG